MPDGKSLGAQARALVALQAWGALCTLLEGHRAAVEGDLELAALLGEGLLRSGRAREARTLLLPALGRPRARGADPTVRRAIILTGAAHFELGELDEAQQAFERAAELAQRDGDDLLAAQASNNLAMIANIRGRPEEALARYRVALVAWQRLGHAQGIATSLHNMGFSYRDTARLDEADEYHGRAIEFARDAGDERLVAIATTSRAEVALLRGNASMAEAVALHAAARLAGIPDPLHQADALRLAALARAERSSPDTALSLADEAVTLAHTCGASLIEAEALRVRASLFARCGDRARARSDGERARDLFARLRAAREQRELTEWLATLA